MDVHANSHSLTKMSHIMTALVQTVLNCGVQHTLEFMKITDTTATANVQKVGSAYLNIHV